MTQIQSTSNSAVLPAATHQSAETLAAYGSAQPVPSRLPSHLHQGSMNEISDQHRMNEISDQHNVLLETTLVDIPDEVLGLIGNFLPPQQDVRAFESTNRMLRGVAEQGYFNGLKQEPIDLTIHSLEELERITPVCNRLNEQGYKIHLHLNFNQPLVLGDIPAGVQQLTFGDMFDQPLVPGVIPAGVQQVSFGWRFNQPLVRGVIRVGVQQLTFREMYNQPLALGVIPVDVEVTFGLRSNHPITRVELDRMIAGGSRALSRADLRYALLSGANLSGLDLSERDLSRANLSRANLIGFDLSGTNLRGADLSRANLRGANLPRVDLIGVDLEGVQNSVSR